jgi:hypothetical protein
MYFFYIFIFAKLVAKQIFKMEGSQMKKYMIAAFVYFLPIQSMQEPEVVPKNEDGLISYKKMVTTFGYPAAAYLINAWTRKKNAPAAPNFCFTPYNILPELKPTIDNYITTHDDEYLFRLRAASYIPQLSSSPCPIKAFNDQFDKEGNPIIISWVLGKIMLFDMTQKQWGQLSGYINISGASCIACKKTSFLYGTYDGNVYLRGPDMGSISLSAYRQQITAVALGRKYLAWGNEYGRMNVYSIGNQEGHYPYANSASLILETVHPDLEPTTALAVFNNYIFAGHGDGILKIWSCREKAVIQEIATEEKDSGDVTSVLPGEPYIRIGYGNGDFITYDRCMPSRFVHKAKGMLHDHKPIVAITQNRKNDTLYTATNTKLIPWRPGFDCEEAYTQLTLAERLWVHYAFQDSLPEHLQR